MPPIRPLALGLVAAAAAYVAAAGRRDAQGGPAALRSPCGAWVELSGAVQRAGAYCLDRRSPAALLDAAGAGCAAARRPATPPRPPLERGGRLAVVRGAGGACRLATRPQAAARRLLLGGLVDLNRAGAAELEGLPGIGPALARRLVATRARLGRFAALDELLEVRGVGARLVARLRGRVTVGIARDGMLPGRGPGAR